MRVIKSIFISFSIYSKIPVPQFEWREEDMKYILVFFPWIGLVIAGAMWLWLWCCQQLGINSLCRVLIGTAIPIIITGGFHVDGYMDTMDALHSYQSREKKLEILKDAHIGAFAVIMLVLYYLIYAGAFSQLCDIISSGLLNESILGGEVTNTEFATIGTINYCIGNRIFIVWCLGFYLSRILSGIGVVSFKPAREDGMLVTFADTAHKKLVKFGLYFQLGICLGIMGYMSLKVGICVIVAALISFVYYYYKSKKEFGGITGDTAGFFVIVCECVITIAAVIGGMI